MIRSLLFVPGDSERKIAKGLSGEADALILDLEDSVAAEKKASAREVVAEALRTHSGAGPQLWVRINPLQGGEAEADLAATAPFRPAGIVLPKSRNGHDVEYLSALLRPFEAEADIADGTIRILPIVTETAAAVLAAGTYADRTKRLAALTWGAEDLATDLGAAQKRNETGVYRDVFRLARSLALLGAMAAGVEAVDTVFPDFRDEDAFALECRDAAVDGFTGKMAIHPAQVPVINDAFTPTEADIATARSIVEAFEAAGNPGVLAVDGRMLDRPHLVQARRLLARVVSN